MPAAEALSAVLQGQSLAKGDAQARGHLQSQLARTLLGCPNAIIIVEGLQQMHPGLLPIWINGLSEQVWGFESLTPGSSAGQ